MVAAIEIRHLSGSAAHPDGSVREFAQPRVRLGRGAECDLQFDPHNDRAVSAIHAELVLVDGEVRAVDCDSRNGLFVNDARVETARVLQSGDVVRLGADGPQFVVRFVGDRHGSGAPGPSLHMPETAYVEPELPPAQLDDAGRTAHARLAEAAGSGGQETRKKTIGMNTLLGVVNQTVRRERRRTRLIVIPILSVLVATILTVVFWPKEPSRAWRDVLAVPSQSVYVCALKAAGNAEPFGTAWSLGDGMLATNAHVAAEFDGMDAGQEFVVRSCSTPPRDLRIVKVTVHPAYTKWAELVLEYDPYVPGQGFQRMLPPAYDVALLHVHEDDVAALAPGLPIASRRDVLDTVAGDEVALVGYPMEAQAGKGVNMTAPYPQWRPGTVSRATDYFLAAGSVEKRLLLGLNLSSAGGASGSPVLNRSGEVVAVNSAGDYMTLAAGPRIRSGGAYGQRVDVLLDLIAGKVTGPDSTAVARLEAEFLERFQNGVADPGAFASWLGSLILRRGEKLGAGVASTFTVATAGPGGEVQLPDHQAPSDGEYVRVVFPTHRPVPARISSLRMFGYSRDKGVRYFLVDRWVRQVAKPLRAKAVVDADAEIAQPLPYMLYWFPITKQ